MQRVFQGILICLLCFLVSTTHAARCPINLVFLTFSDTTPYSEMKTNEVIDDFLLEELLNINSINVMERRVVKEALEAEKKLVISSKDVDEIVANNDFATVFAAAENDLNNKMCGEYVPEKQTKIIGQKYHADYILHGTIDYLGKGKSYMMLPIPQFVISSVNPYLEAWVTVRLIESDTGKIVWSRKEKGVSKDSLYNIQGVTFGTSQFSNQLFVEAMKKISKKVAENFEKDLEQGKLILHKS